MPVIPHDLISELRDIFAERLTPEGLEILAWDLGIIPYNIRGETHLLRAQNFAITLWQQGKLPQLAAVGSKHNNSVPWAALLSDHGIAIPALPPDEANPPFPHVQGDSPMPIDPVSASIVVASLPSLFELFRPGVQTITTKVADAFGNVLQHQIYARFMAGAQLIDPNGPDTRAEYEALAHSVVNGSTPQEVKDAEGRFQRAALQLLRDPDFFSRVDLQNYWQDFRRPANTESFTDMWERKGHTQAGAAEELVREATRAGKWSQLLEKVLTSKPK